jgi:hypothetical protein
VRRAAKRDLSEPAIVTALRLCGWSVQPISVPDAPDLILGKAGRTYLAEVKTGKGKVKPGQALWHREWRGADVVILRSVDDALRFEQTYGRETKCG